MKSLRTTVRLVVSTVPTGVPVAVQVGNIKDSVGGLVGNNDLQVRRSAPPAAFVRFL